MTLGTCPRLVKFGSAYWNFLYCIEKTSFLLVLEKNERFGLRGRRFNTFLQSNDIPLTTRLVDKYADFAFFESV